MPTSKNILVTGGVGYIGSHLTLSLLELGYNVIIVDNLSNSSIESLQRVKSIVGRKPFFVKGDIRDANLLKNIFYSYDIEAVLHLAGLKSVAESVNSPIKYYDNNFYGSQVLLKSMSDAKVFNLVFSSSATVYGHKKEMPIKENSLDKTPLNPYGRSKLMVEDMLNDLAYSDSRWNIAILRYFNPVGAHSSGLIGEAPSGIPNNLVPYISQVAIGKLKELTVFGNDYPTFDGTGVRDYIHVVDLAEGHLRALEFIRTHVGFHVWNLGTGIGYSVLDVVRAFEAASGCSIPYRIVQRRAGDIAVCYADPTKAHHELGWKASRSLHDMMADSWRWQKFNPNGY